MKPSRDDRWLKLMSEWTPEKAWFLGILYGDGNVHSSRTTNVVSAAGHITTISRWLALATDSLPRRHQCSEVTYYGAIYSKRFVAWFRDNLGICGPKSATMTWPTNVPVDCMRHFVRGLWDSDGNIRLDGPKQYGRRGNSFIAARYTTKSRLFVEELRRVTMGAVGGRAPKIYETANDAYVLSYCGRRAVSLLSWIYDDAPEHLRNEQRYQAFRRAFDAWAARPERLYVSSSGYRGVNLHRASGLWRARIHRNGRETMVGYFSTPEEANAARACALGFELIPFLNAVAAVSM
jgi:hypothetical protein